MNKEETKKRSLDLHRKFRGKISVNSDVPVKTRDDMSLAYTPGVAEVSKVIAKDKSLAKELTIKGRTIAVVSDGSAVLGLGNIGPEAALPVMEGKALLFKEFAGVDAFPIVLSTQDVDEIVETVVRISPGFGGVNLEDISAPRCFEVEKKLKERLSIPVMHDDQHGTAVVVLAGMINSLKLRSSDKEDVRVVINGSGAAGVAITKILLTYGLKQITVLDSKGILTGKRDDLNEYKKEIVQITGSKDVSEGSLEDAVKGADIFVGVSACCILSKEMIQSMKDDPIIFALANPEPEIMPDEAKEAGAFVIATGRSDFPNQVNNVLAFPGIFKGALKNDVVNLTEEMFVRAAESLAAHVENPSQEKILPDVFDKDLVDRIAETIREDT